MITLPKLLDWYSADFGHSTQQLLLRVAAMLDRLEGRPDDVGAESRNEAMAGERAIGGNGGIGGIGGNGGIGGIGSGYEEGWGLEEGGGAVRAAVLGDDGGDVTIEYAPYSWAQPEHK